MRLACLLLAASAAVHAAPARPLAAVVAERLLEADSPVCVAVGAVDERVATHLACGPGAGTVAFDADSIFRIGSVTKGLTGLLLAEMVVRGEVELDDPASRHSRPGARLPTRGGREITLRDLVTHTSGLPRVPADFEPRDPANPYGHLDADALYASLAATELARDIGSAYEYSNFGFMWLSEMLARRAGTTYEQALRERVLLPLGMGSTGIRPTREQESRMVKGHDARYAIIPDWTVGENLGGVGLVHSSLNDMLKLAAALSGRRSTPLDAAIALALVPPSPRAAPDVGFAWNARPEGRYDHGGGAGGFVAHVAFDRKRRAASVVLADAAVSVADLALHLVDPGYHLRRRPVMAPLDEATRRLYPGSYAASTIAIEVWDEGPRLIARLGDSVYELLHQGHDAFYVQHADVRVAFTRSAAGEVEGLALYVNGRQSRARRISP